MSKKWIAVCIVSALVAVIASSVFYAWLRAGEDDEIDELEISEPSF